MRTRDDTTVSLLSLAFCALLLLMSLFPLKMKGKIFALWLLVLSEIFEYRSAFRILKSGQSVPDASYFKPYDKVVFFKNKMFWLP